MCEELHGSIKNPPKKSEARGKNCIVGISVGRPEFTGQSLKQILAAVDEYELNPLLLIGDTLQRYNHASHEVELLEAQLVEMADGLSADTGQIDQIKARIAYLKAIKDSRPVKGLHEELMKTLKAIDAISNGMGLAELEDQKSSLDTETLSVLLKLERKAERLCTSISNEFLPYSREIGVQWSKENESILESRYAFNWDNLLASPEYERAIKDIDDWYYGETNAHRVFRESINASVEEVFSRFYKRLSPRLITPEFQLNEKTLRLFIRAYIKEECGIIAKFTQAFDCKYLAYPSVPLAAVNDGLSRFIFLKEKLTWLEIGIKSKKRSPSHSPEQKPATPRSEPMPRLDIAEPSAQHSISRDFKKKTSGSHYIPYGHDSYISHGRSARRGLGFFEKSAQAIVAETRAFVESTPPSSPEEQVAMDIVAMYSKNYDLKKIHQAMGEKIEEIMIRGQYNQGMKL